MSENDDAFKHADEYFASKIELIKNDLSNGSSIITKNALMLLTEAGSFFTGPDVIIFTVRMAEQMKTIRPSFSALRNLLGVCIKEMVKGGDEINLDMLVRDIISKMESAGNLVIERASDKIAKDRQNINILTCSYSSLIIRFINHLKKAGLSIKIITIETSWKGQYFGAALVKKCNETGVRAKAVGIDDLSAAIDVSDVIVLGADTILHDGSAINGLPSYKLLTMNNLRLPVFVLAESYKRSSDIFLEDGFDYIPGYLISEIIFDDLF